jgi:ArsR family transcriptional regulator, arsenate/arsenite/antimonite-responsive transcriptional repressor
MVGMSAADPSPPEAVAALAALAHEHRLALFRLLVERGPDGLAAGVIATRLGLVPSSLTFHLQHLHRAGLITQRRVGRQLIYAADYAAMNGLLAYLTRNCCGRDDATGDRACRPGATAPAQDRRTA